jgi:hypothetical protein
LQFDCPLPATLAALHLPADIILFRMTAARELSVPIAELQGRHSIDFDKVNSDLALAINYTVGPAFVTHQVCFDKNFFVRVDPSVWKDHAGGPVSARVVDVGQLRGGRVASCATPRGGIDGLCVFARPALSLRLLNGNFKNSMISLSIKAGSKLRWRRCGAWRAKTIRCCRRHQTTRPRSWHHPKPPCGLVTNLL